MTNRVQHLTIPTVALRDRALAGLDHGDSYALWRDAFPVLDEIQVGHGRNQPPLVDHLTVGAWNLERGACWEAAAERVLAENLDVLLASEMDCGMSRSAQSHTTQALANALGWHWVYGIEFIELGTGSPWEQNQPEADATNDCGLHGNAILSRYPLDAIRLIRFENGDGEWWHRRWNEPRLGGRMALIASIHSAYGPVQLVSTHLESNSHPMHRASQMSELLDLLTHRLRPLWAVISIPILSMFRQFPIFSGHDSYSNKQTPHDFFSRSPMNHCSLSWPMPDIGKVQPTPTRRRNDRENGVIQSLRLGALIGFLSVDVSPQIQEPSRHLITKALPSQIMN